MAAVLARLADAAPALAWMLAAAVALAAAGLAALAARRAPPAARHQVWTLGVLAALALPLLGWLAPAALSPWSLAAPTVEPLVAPAMQIQGGASAPGSGVAGLVALVWGAGALVVALGFLRGHLAAARLGRHAGAAPAAWTSAAREVAAALGVRGALRLHRSDAIAAPMTLGILRPRVLLPAAADAWPAERLRAILAHELGHVRRRDTLVQLLAQLACSVYWWNPLAWLAAARLRAERERACDDLVLGLGVRASSYAADLLDVARGLTPAGAAGIVERGGTEARIRRVLDAGARRRPPGAGFRVAAGAVAGALSVGLAWASVAPRHDWRHPRPRPAVGVAPRPLDLGGPALPVGDPLLALTPVELDDFAAAVEPRRADLERCFARRLGERPGLAGSLAVEVVVDASGAPLATEVLADSLGDAEVSACVEAAIGQTRFPAPRGAAATVVLPFRFGGSDDGC